MKTLTYLILGGQEEKKEAAIASLKKKYLPDSDAQKLDYEVLYADKLSGDTLSESLLSLPAVASRRLVVLRAAHKLSASNKDILLRRLNEPASHLVLVLESSSLNSSDSFVKKIAAFAQVQEFSVAAKANVFDMTRALGARKTEEALKILSGLFTDGVNPLMVMGGLVWFWQKSQARLSLSGYEKGLRILQEADLNIKRSRMNSEYAVEVAVVKLAALC